MTSNNYRYPENMRIYYRYVRNRRSDTEKTKKKVMQYLMYFEDYLGGKPLKKIRPNDIDTFAEFLDKRSYNGKPIAGSTKLGAINLVGKFFEWLSHIDGYKRVISYEILKYFVLAPKEKKVLRGDKKVKRYPSLDEAKKVVESISADSIIGRRLRGMIAYLFLTGARIEATASMKIGLVDLAKRTVYQYPAKEVRTKYRKKIETTIPYIDEFLFRVLKDYYQELLIIGFKSEDPLFPKAKQEKGDSSLAFTKSNSLSKEFMSEKSMSKLVKEACRNAGYEKFHCHSYRDGHICYMLVRTKSPQDLKAVSLNMGHDSIMTTLEEYADIGMREVHDRILAMTTPSPYDLNELPNDVKQLMINILRVTKQDVYEKYFGNTEDQVLSTEAKQSTDKTKDGGE